MQRIPSKGTSERPPLPQPSKSFSRYEPPESPTKLRSRSNTINTEAAKILQAPSNSVLDDTSVAKDNSDIFERLGIDAAVAENAGDENGASDILGAGYEDLPIEIQSLMERFLESLSLRSQSSSQLSIDRLSELYQDFYEHARTQINRHIATLATRLSRDQSPAPSVSSGRSNASRGPARKNSRPLERINSLDPLAGEQQMLTATEITDKRKARKQLELKRVAMEEAVERGVCEKVYPRLWRHASTNDEARDEKLRSRAAALSVLGVDLKELLSSALSETVTLTADLNTPTEDDTASPRSLLSSARKSLKSMNEQRFALGKLDHLIAVHKHIVEALQQMFPSTSSADEVLPTLIYTIITSPPETNSIISNFNFIQRFRMTSKVDGETAYCLTNLEAAITFLETVDLTSIRPEEGAQGPVKMSSTPRSETPDPMYRGLPSDPSTPASSSTMANTKSNPPSTRARSLSNIMQSRTRPLEVASGVVLSSADAAFDNIHSALDGGFKFLFGRMKEKQAQSPHQTPVVAAPKTLEDARKLISPTVAPGDDDASISESAIADHPIDPVDENSMKPEDKTMETLSGRRNSNNSTDSNRSVGSVNRKNPGATKASGVAPVSSTQSNSYAAVESMRSLGNTLNPLKGFSGIGMIRGFGRSSSPVSTGPAMVSSPAVSPLSAEPSASQETLLAVARDAAVSGQHAPEEETAETAAFSWDSVAPPIQRFVELKEPKEMNFYDVALLLRDYQRLAGAFYASRAS